MRQEWRGLLYLIAAGLMGGLLAVVLVVTGLAR